LINARSETVSKLPTFSGAMRKKRRCVVVSTGFFEWEKALTKTGRKTPFLINVREDEAAEPAPVLYMAGIYDVSTSPQDPDTTLYTFAICTTAASEQFEWLHHRLPCILPNVADVKAWLDGRTEAPERLLRTLHSGLSWRQMSQNLDRTVSQARSRHVKPDVRNYFAKKNGDASSSAFSKSSLAQRNGLELQSPIRKKTKKEPGAKKSPRKASETKKSPQKVRAKTENESAKEDKKAGQRKITSFFQKK